MARAFIFFLTIATAPAQDPLTTAPQAYKLQFDNEWVRVTRVHYAARARIPAHDHSRWPAAYVYLNDGGPIIFRHVGWDKHPDLTRPATKAGSFRLSPTLAATKTHEVINPTDTPSDFLRIEFKTQPDDKKPPRGRFYRAQSSAGENLSRVHFENEQLRATRLLCAPRRSLDVAARGGEPVLLVFLSAARLRITDLEGQAGRVTFRAGQIIWLAGGRRERFENVGGESAEFLRFDFRTAPASPRSESKR